MIVVTALIAGAAVVTSMHLRAARAADLTRTGMSSLYCAESGLAVVRATVARSYAGWNAALAAGTEPSWLAGVDHDLDGDGRPDFAITLRDNDDEAAPLANDPARDNDLRVYVVSRCLQHPDTAREVTELVQLSGGGTCYEAQLGGCGGNNNAN